MSHELLEDDDSAPILGLFAWAERAGALGLEQIKVDYFEKSGQPVRSLAAAQHVVGPILLPRSLLISADSAEELALRLAEEVVKSKNGMDTVSEHSSFWEPWIKTLPTQKELHQCLPCFASPEILLAFAKLPLMERVQDWREQLEADWKRLAPRAGDGGISFEDFKWAAGIVLSRVYVPPPEYMFMPFADMMNAGPQPNMEVFDRLEVDMPGGSGGKEECSLVPDFFGLVPLKAVPSGQELLQGYTKVDNSERLFRGGFLLEDNPVCVEPLSVEACKELLSIEISGAPDQEQLVTCLKGLVREHCRQSGVDCAAVLLEKVRQFYS